MELDELETEINKPVSPNRKQSNFTLYGEPRLSWLDDEPTEDYSSTNDRLDEEN